MPIYEYQCMNEKCSNTIITEKMQKVTDKPPVCPDCNKEMTKLISRGGFILKGSGWYKSGHS